MTEQGSPKPRIARRVVTWLWAGYPAGVPRKDYIALLGILHRRLTVDEIESIAADLSCLGSNETPISENEIVDAIRSHTHQHPDEDDMRRVRSHLALDGWPVASVEQAASETGEPPLDDDPDQTH